MTQRSPTQRLPARRIGILGGTFDPIHRGHVDLGRAAQSALGLTHVFVVPTHMPPHRAQPVASSYHRFAMVALTVAGRAGWQATDVELGQDRTSYTSLTLLRFHDRGFAPFELFFLIGADAFIEIGSWKDYPDILDRAHFAVVSRPGCPVADLPRRLPELAARMTPAGLGTAVLHDACVIVLIEAPTAEVSSTAIRSRLAAGQAITGLVEPHVQQHIEQHELYTAAVPGRREDDRSADTAAGRLHGQS
jgi:nicotinate-nucleotide adenylyltransferase